jgi:hypothetical protein
MTTGEGPLTSEWIKSNEEEEIKIFRLKGKSNFFANLHPLQLENIKRLQIL